MIRIKRSRTSSPSARVLKESLHEVCGSTRMLLMEESTWAGNNKSLLINWGSSAPLYRATNAKVLNKPEKIINATDKLKTFKLLTEADIKIPWYIESRESNFFTDLTQKVMDSNVGGKFMFRTTATGFGGAGIHVITSIKRLAAAHHNMRLEELNTSDVLDYLYHLRDNDSEWSSIIRNTVFVSQYFPADQEFRVHVICGGIVFSQAKKLRTDEDRPAEPDFTVRNHSNGFIFQQNGVEVPETVKQASIKAVHALGLDFGAVDVRYNVARDEYSILEVNTAPSITGNTLEAYTKVFKSVYDIVSE